MPGDEEEFAPDWAIRDSRGHHSDSESEAREQSSFRRRRSRSPSKKRGGSPAPTPARASSSDGRPKTAQAAGSSDGRPPAAQAAKRGSAGGKSKGSKGRGLGPDVSGLASRRAAPSSLGAGPRGGHTPIRGGGAPRGRAPVWPSSPRGRATSGYMPHHPPSGNFGPRTPFQPSLYQRPHPARHSTLGYPLYPALPALAPPLLGRGVGHPPVGLGSLSRRPVAARASYSRVPVAMSALTPSGRPTRLMLPPPRPRPLVPLSRVAVAAASRAAAAAASRAARPGIARFGQQRVLAANRFLKHSQLQTLARKRAAQPPLPRNFRLQREQARVATRPTVPMPIPRGNATRQVVSRVVDARLSSAVPSQGRGGVPPPKSFKIWAGGKRRAVGTVGGKGGKYVGLPAAAAAAARARAPTVKREKENARTYKGKEVRGRNHVTQKNETAHELSASETRPNSRRKSRADARQALPRQNSQIPPRTVTASTSAASSKAVDPKASSRMAVGPKDSPKASPRKTTVEHSKGSNAVAPPPWRMKSATPKATSGRESEPSGAQDPATRASLAAKEKELREKLRQRFGRDSTEATNATDDATVATGSQQRERSQQDGDAIDRRRERDHGEYQQNDPNLSQTAKRRRTLPPAARQNEHSSNAQMTDEKIQFPHDSDKQQRSRDERRQRHQSDSSAGAQGSNTDWNSGPVRTVHTVPSKKGDRDTNRVKQQRAKAVDPSSRSIVEREESEEPLRRRGPAASRQPSGGSSKFDEDKRVVHERVPKEEERSDSVEVVRVKFSQPSARRERDKYTSIVAIKNSDVDDLDLSTLRDIRDVPNAYEPRTHEDPRVHRSRSRSRGHRSRR